MICPSQKLYRKGATRKRPLADCPQRNVNPWSIMNKTMIETISEAIRDPKHPFRKTDSHPRKAMKHRYERRKIKEYLHLADWEAEAI